MILRVADEAWIATALLTENTLRRRILVFPKFASGPTLSFMKTPRTLVPHRESLCGFETTYACSVSHATRNGPGKRRLYRTGDPCHPKRKGKIHPDKEQLPDKYRKLVDWYAEDYSHAAGESGKSNSLAVLTRFIGTISAFDLQRMSSAINAGCERVDPNEW